jgi:hypothetical protein
MKKVGKVGYIENQFTKTCKPNLAWTSRQNSMWAAWRGREAKETKLEHLREIRVKSECL